MKTRLLAALVLLCLALAPAAVADDAPDYTAKTPPPKQLSDAVRKLLGDVAIQFVNAKQETIAEIWLAKDPAVKATAEQFKNGLTYREVPSSTILGAIRVVKAMTDYKKQKIAPGVYTLRMGLQPQDGDHMGTAPYNEFALLCPAADDRKTALLEAKELRELSARTTDNHPGVLVLFPAEKDATDTPRLLSKTGGHWVLFLRLPVVSGDRKGTLPLGINLVGHSASA